MNMHMTQIVEIPERPGMSDELKERISNFAGKIPSGHAVVVKQTKGGRLFLQGRHYYPWDSSGISRINRLCVDAYDGNNTGEVYIILGESETGEITIKEHRGKYLIL
ncbi:MAG TPA: hypothetical protein DIC35_01010 [Candidatus Moranbacteria bacterium]|nr:hypothetical protein [Candidatus Moranbacteria bacterium]